MGETKHTRLAFHYNGKLLKLRTTIASVHPVSALEEANRQSLKLEVAGTGEDDELYVIVVKETIFHPQGGGQPSDEGEISTATATMTIKTVRMDVVNEGQVLHVGRFKKNQTADTTTTTKPMMQAGQDVDLVVDGEKRLLYSRLHTAGHVLGSAVRHLLEKEIDGFDELKASHFPDSAACEFQGLIEAKWKPAIQDCVDEYLGRAMPVEIDFWTEDDFRRNGLERLIPPRSILAPGEDRFRVVRIVGAEVYPCGGTHVDSTDECGATRVKKISRSKGVSRVSYTVA